MAKLQNFELINKNHIMQKYTPRIIRNVPNKAKPTRVSSPRSIPKTAVAANVVALVTGTAKEIGVSLRIAKKVADAERFTMKGTEYCQVSKRLNQFSMVLRTWLCWDLFVWAIDLIFSSQISAPFRMRALVAPQTSPTATIFCTSPIFVGISQYFCWPYLFLSLRVSVKIKIFNGKKPQSP